MPSHSQQQHSPYGTQQLFDMVADIESYPQFLPWCRAARIVEHQDDCVLAELVISFSYMTENYTSKVELTRPESSTDSGEIAVTMVKGPFEYLVNRWHFISDDTGGSTIDFFIDFKFRSRLMEKMMGGLFSKATMKMVQAFSERADALYGKGRVE